MARKSLRNAFQPRLQGSLPHPYGPLRLHAPPPLPLLEPSRFYPSSLPFLSDSTALHASKQRRTRLGYSPGQARFARTLISPYRYESSTSPLSQCSSQSTLACEAAHRTSRLRARARLPWREDEDERRDGGGVLIACLQIERRRFHVICAELRLDKGRDHRDHSVKPQAAQQAYLLERAEAAPPLARQDGVEQPGLTRARGANAPAHFNQYRTPSNSYKLTKRLEMRSARVYLSACAGVYESGAGAKERQNRHATPLARA
eukprot:6201403-Pleurochrysis_carterae.AAC.1